jgi:folate-binding protein YgfZ
MSTSDQTTFVRASDPAVLVLRGDDAGEFLNGQVTNDVAALADGESRYALLLTAKGKLRAELTIARDGDETLIVCAAEQLPTIVQTIDTFRIGYFFSSEDASGRYALIHLLGTAEAPAAIGVPFVELTAPLGVDLLVETEEAEALTGALKVAGFREGSPADHDAARVAAGVPAWPEELGEDTFPAEAGLEERAVSFEKGCYVGQETVARMHYKGRPNRHLRILRADGALATGAEVTAKDGRALGQLGTVAAHGETAAALAILRREAEPGDVVDAGGTPATIVR